MMRAEVTPKTITHKLFICPCGCEDTHRYDHLREGSNAGPWFCDGCGVGWFVSIRDGVPVLADKGMRKAKIPVRLRCKVDGGSNLDLVVMYFLFRDDGKMPTASDYDSDSAEHYFEEYTCPINYLRRAVRVELDGEEDPHGVFDLVGPVGGVGMDGGES